LIGLQKLVQRLGGELSLCVGDLTIREVQLDSRQVQPGDLFVAVQGGREDGNAYVQDAIARGAAAVLTRGTQGREGTLEVQGVPHWTHGRVRRTAGRAAAMAQGPPPGSLEVVGITGTNGKTTCAHLLGQLLETGGLAPAVLGTAGHRLSGGLRERATLTTPPAPELQRLLARHQRAGGRSAVMEVSSHALDQQRTAGVDFRVGIFTNLSREHLDYHRDMRSYLAAKSRLFENLTPGSTAVLNKDDPAWEHLARVAEYAGARTITYSVQQTADFMATGLRTDVAGSRFTFDGMGIFSTELRIPLRGRFNVQNALAAIAAAHCLGVSPSTLLEGLTTFLPAPGRMEPVPCPGREFEIFVDYAHTPAALEQALCALRESLGEPLPGRDGRDGRAAQLWVVFGCGGDRDRGKRSEMGRVACANADRVIVTSDNPRSEEPQAIAEDILRGMSAGAGSDTCSVQLDRRKAIEFALREARPGDVILVAGKGHETEQWVAGRALAFDDRVVIQEALCAGSSA
jgi:UDP-N-acetylmuramoyl-L-alanyl-D-glutamate--2,6-diaminopimelate ligase